LNLFHDFELNLSSQAQKWMPVYPTHPISSNAQKHLNLSLKLTFVKIFCNCVDKSDINLNSNHRFELELKYTRMVDIHSRPTLPRVDMHHVVHHLNRVEEGTEGRYIDYDGDEDDDIDN